MTGRGEAGVDLGAWPAISALFTVATSVGAAAVALTKGKRAAREEVESSRKEWADIATRRLEMIGTQQAQLDEMKGSMVTINLQIGEMRAENRVLRQRNVELQVELDRAALDRHQLRADLRRAGVEVPEEPKRDAR